MSNYFVLCTNPRCFEGTEIIEHADGSGLAQRCEWCQGAGGEWHSDEEDEQ